MSFVGKLVVTNVEVLLDPDQSEAFLLHKRDVPVDVRHVMCVILEFKCLYTTIHHKQCITRINN
jgi:hypothetical protein